LVVEERPVVAVDREALAAERQVVALVAPQLGFRGVVVVAVELDDEVGTRPMGVDGDAVNGHVEAGDGQAMPLAEVQEGFFERAVGLGELGLVGLERLVEALASSAPVLADGVEGVDVELVAVVEVRKRLAHEAWL
jgi:hypothetical protein